LAFGIEGANGIRGELDLVASDYGAYQLRIGAQIV
jgi:hypothetical protein